MPDHVLYRSPLGKLTNRNVPLLLFILTLILWLLGLVEGSYCCMFACGLLIGWLYLRFYQIHANGARGDLAEGFAFHTFFPNVVQPPIAFLCQTIFSALVKMRLCKRPVRKYDIGSARSAISISLPGVESHDTERRRQIALKALSERLHRAEGPTDPHAKTEEDLQDEAWPNLEGNADAAKTGVLESVHIAIERKEEEEEEPSATQSNST